MKVDLHCHTSASDGSLAPGELLQRALEREIDCLAITDHDTTRGYEILRQELQSDSRLKLIAGTEISCNWQERTIHIVALNFQVDHQGLQGGLQRIRQSRRDRAAAMLEKFDNHRHFNFPDMQQKLEELVGEGVVGRGHFAELLIREGRVKNAQQAFDRFLKKGRIGYVKAEWPSLQEVVGWIRDAGGVAVIAHPALYKLTSRKLNQLIEDFIDAGGKAIEVVNQPRPCADIIGMAERARRYGLYASVGSDFHRPEHRWRDLGWLAPLPESVAPVWDLF
ncbi:MULTISPECIES: PHP domain-containing protein [Thiomicrorhabdus]|uniref:PHP domain-containing protein n=1 Tax=Thiomicrorhabdus heinhorstiae TaxID=2748010 RepID=A0ABS0BSR0_9GAMM|nr:MULTISPECIES: PHP domain-containing protein [Thiomicrorhabdus]MBF6056868.1 PHP domain-containing protein [Thiomicrorhabdus heinhorstiae]